MELNTLTALSPLDGRYHQKTKTLSPLMSEFGLIKARCQVEIEWLIFLAKQPSILELNSFSSEQVDKLRHIYLNFSIKDAEHIKEIEQTTNHDVKAVEYYLRSKLSEQEDFQNYLSFIHFACTSEDINNLAYSIILKQALKDIISPEVNKITDKLASMAQEYADIAMLARTHGQSASPTTIGKELINFADRLHKNLCTLKNVKITGKINGAVGNYNAHRVAYPNINWPELAKQFVENLGLNFSSYTTQINPHDDIAEFSQNLIRINNILLDLARDTWGYISLNYFNQKINTQEVYMQIS